MDPLSPTVIAVVGVGLSLLAGASWFGKRAKQQAHALAAKKQARARHEQRGQRLAKLLARGGYELVTRDGEHCFEVLVGDEPVECSLESVIVVQEANEGDYYALLLHKRGDEGPALTEAERHKALELTLFYPGLAGVLVADLSTGGLRQVSLPLPKPDPPAPPPTPWGLLALAATLGAAAGVAAAGWLAR